MNRAIAWIYLTIGALTLILRPPLTYAFTTTRVSVASDGTQGNAMSLHCAISGDGRYVAFESRASNLVPGDTNNCYDIYIHDRQTSQTTRVSMAPDGTQGNSTSAGPAISANGHYVTFSSMASNLVPGDTNGTVDVFVYQRLTSQTTRVSVSSDGVQGNERSSPYSISADGRYVGFCSWADNLVPGDTNGCRDAFVHDRLTGQTTRVSVATDGTEGNAESAGSFLSADGRYVVFQSKAYNLVPGDTNNGCDDIFVHDRLTSTTTLVSATPSGTPSIGGDSLFNGMSADGRYVVFCSFSIDLLPATGWTSGMRPLLRDLVTHTTTLLTDEWITWPAITPNGRYVFFMSSDPNLVPGDTVGTADWFRLDISSGAISMANGMLGCTEGFSTDGSCVVFWSDISNLVPGDTNGTYDVFVREFNLAPPPPSDPGGEPQPSPTSDSDGDSSLDEAELGPQGNNPHYDGNGDGTPDWRQGNVVSLPTLTDTGPGYLTIAAPSGQRILNTQAFRSPDGLPEGVSLPFGYVSFIVSGVSPSGCTTVTFYLDGPAPQTYYKYGPTPDNLQDHWYEFTYDGETGAEVTGATTMVVHLCDGKRGDHDLVANGQIVDPGGPAAIEAYPVLYYPLITGHGDEETALGLINRERYRVQCTVTFYGSNNGTVAGTKTLSLAPQGKGVIPVTEVPANAVSAIVSANGTMVGYARYQSAVGQRYALPGISRVVNTLPIAHVAANSYWRTALAFLNPNDSSVTIRVLDEAGSSEEIVLGAKAQELYWVQSGEAPREIRASGKIAAVEVFDNLSPGGDRAAVVLETAGRSELCVPALFFGPGEFTGIGLRNTSLNTGTVTGWGYSPGGGQEGVSFGAFAAQERLCSNLGSVFGLEMLWARIQGLGSSSTPFGQNSSLPLQGIVLYGSAGVEKLGALNLNSLTFEEGILGVVGPDASPTVTLLNPGATDAVVGATGYGSGGGEIARGSITVNAGTTLTVPVAELVANAALSETDYVRLECDEELCGFETISTRDRMELLPVLK